MVRVLHLSTEKAWRGGESQLLTLLTGLKPSDVTSFVVTQLEPTLAQRFSPFASVHNITMRNDLDMAAVIKIARLCRREKIDIIHAHTARGHSLGLLVIKLLKTLYGIKPRLVVHRRVEHTSRPGLAGFISHRKYLDGDIGLFICVSKAVGRGLEKIGVSKDKIQVIYSAVDGAAFGDRDALRSKIRREWKTNQNDVVVLCIAAMEKAKGVDVLVHAWQSVAQQFPNATLMMVGEGAMKDELMQKVSTSKDAGRIVFTGFRRDIPALIAGSDIVVLPTLWEGLGTVLLEGLLGGAAVIGSDVGGVPEIIIDGQTGLLVRPSSSSDLVRALGQLIDDHPLRQRLAAAGLEHVKTQFSSQKLMDGVEAAYLKAARR